MHIIGTAGHVDHGKSSLVQALTGTNPDRWLEEQERGMTLDLGFAHLQLGNDREAGIIDVPGHERFLHNMLAGAAGMELLLLVVAANEGVMAQTLEHLAILRYLNVLRTIVVVSKADLLSEADLAQRLETIGESLRGTIAENSPMLAVSTVTGAGMEALRSTIAAELDKLTPRRFDAPAYLPIDRVFALSGHGTIVTGTLMQGRIATGDRLLLQPSGKSVRIRSLQTFGQTRTSVEAGARVAANLPGVEVSEIARGEILVAPEFAPVSSLHVRFEALPETRPLLRRRNAVRVYIGSAEILGTLVISDVVLRQPFDRLRTSAHQDDIEERSSSVTLSLSKGDAVDGELFLRKPTIAYPNMPFVVRRLSPKTLLGGGTIARIAASAEPPAPAASENESVVAGVMKGAGLRVLTLAEIAREANLRENLVKEEVERLRERGVLFEVERPSAYVDAQAAENLLERAEQFLAGIHAAEPWAMGVTSLALARAVAFPERDLVRILQALVEDGRLGYRAGYYSLTGHEPALTTEQRRFLEALVPLETAHPFLPAPLATSLAALRVSTIVGIGKAFDTILAKGALVKVNDDLYRGAQIAQIRARVESFLAQHGRMTMAEFRDLIGTSRKYAVPLLEWFDARGITVRSGDYRLLRGTIEKEPAVAHER